MNKKLNFTGERYVSDVHGEIELEHWHRYIVAASLVKDKTVLDIASGEGYGSNYLADFAEEVTGVDISEEAISFANEKYKKDNLKFIVGSCDDIPLHDSSVDVVISFETIEHHEYHQEMMTEIKRVLKADGVLIISSPNKLEHSDKPMHNNEFHVKELYKEEFIELINSYFTNINVFGQRCVYNSRIISDANNSLDEVFFSKNQSEISRLKKINNPLYDIVIASDYELPDVSNSSFEITQKTDNEVYSCLYIDIGEGFFENQRLFYNMNCSDSKSSTVRFDLSEYSGIEKIRFDPTESSIFLILRSSIGVLKNNKKVLLSPVSYNGFFFEPNVFLFSNTDPNLIYDLSMYSNDIQYVEFDVSIMGLFDIYGCEISNVYDVFHDYQKHIDDLHANIDNITKTSSSLFAANKELITIKDKLVCEKKINELKRVIGNAEVINKKNSKGWFSRRKHKQTLKKNRKLLLDSGFFDPQFYYDTYEDVRNVNCDPVIHYLVDGWKELRDPSPEFSTYYYLSKNSDVAAAGINPLVHYLLFGKNENRGINCACFSIDNNQCDSFNNAKGKNDISSNLKREYENKYPFDEDFDDGHKIIAFYLPQFHPFKENDEWWGEGFTEWTNVVSAKPQFVGHQQPQLPGAMGFYDLRVPETMYKQAQMAKQFGVYGFCFYHYYFDGKRLMETPVDNLLSHPEIDMPFMLCWANENWTRRWDGLDNDILIAQNHTPDDDIRFIENIAKYFEDPRYIRIDGKPFFILYNASQLPDARATVKRWRDYWREAKGEELYIAMAQTFGKKNPYIDDFDGEVEFPPHGVIDSAIKSHRFTYLDSLASIARQHESIKLNQEFSGHIFNAAWFALNYMYNPKHKHDLYKAVFPAWDNTPRRNEKASIFVDSSPDLYKEWLKEGLIHAHKNLPVEKRFTFINAWNEWAEGAILEPTRELGFRNLNLTARALEDACVQCKKFKIAVLVHCFYVDMLNDIVTFIKSITYKFVLLISVPYDCYYQVKSELDKCKIQNYIIKEVPNIGFDIAPMFCAFSQEIQDVELVCKIHTKKSLHSPELNGWCHYSLDCLLRDAEHVESIIDTFNSNSEIGIMYPKTFPPLQQNIDKNGSNMEQVRFLIKDKKIDVKNIKFPEGSFYWFRPEALKILFDKEFKLKDFLPENKNFVHKATNQPVDGTLAHCIERSIIYFANKAGYKAERIKTIDNGFLYKTVDFSKLSKHSIEVHSQSKDNQSFKNKKVAIIAHWSKTGDVAPYIYNFAEELKKLGYLIILATEFCNIDDCFFKTFDAVVQRKCSGYDFTSWKAAFTAFPDLYEAQEVLLTNDSIVGPIHPLDHIHQFMDGKYDFWGLLDSQQVSNHFQSYYMVFTRKALSNKRFKTFIDIISSESDKMTYVGYELSLKSWLDKELSCGSYFKSKDMCFCNANNTLIGWDILLSIGFPFIKKSLLRSYRDIDYLVSELKKYGVSIEGLDSNLIKLSIKK